ncbi:hypothetical protein KQJ06_16845, partial [Enterococcus sp. S159_ASV_20]
PPPPLFFLMISLPPRSTQPTSSAASDVYKRQIHTSHQKVTAMIVTTRPEAVALEVSQQIACLLYTSPRPRD